jgi:nucleoside-diphosphate-sugar epimerase
MSLTWRLSLKQLKFSGQVQSLFSARIRRRENTPQFCVMDPNSVYGFSKLAGERWCEYYYVKYGLDVRSIRYPGLIGWRSEPGGGTTDYAVDIFHQALAKGEYESFLSADTALPMMYMEDAIRATLELMEAPAYKITIVHRTI